MSDKKHAHHEHEENMEKAAEAVEVERTEGTEPEEKYSKPEAASKTDGQKQDFKKRLHDFLHTTRGKIVAVIVAIVVLSAVVFSIPASRYAVAGLVIKKDVPITIVDSITGKPVSGVQITLGTQTVRSDGSGKATLYHVPVGSWQLSAKKTYYQDATMQTVVPILFGQAGATIKIEATGRQVPISVINKIGGKPVPSVEITAGDASAITGDDGKAVMVLPAGKDVVSATFKVGGFNITTADVTVTEQEDAKNTVSLTPAGKLYFLSKRTGKINVMKSDLDGANQEVVVAGTGKESDTETTLLASRDWQYLALKARRDNGEAKLYLISTATNALTVIDEGTDGTYFSPVGWYNEHFIYRVDRPSVKVWQPKRASIKTFNAKSNKITTVDDTAGEGVNDTTWANEAYTDILITENNILFGKYWNHSYYAPLLLNGKKDVIVSFKPDGSGKQNLKELDTNATSFMQSVVYQVNEVVFRVNRPGGSQFYEYEDGHLSDSTTYNDSNFDASYPTYLVSPSGERTFWYEPRDGKKILMLGDKKGANGKEVATDGSTYTPYGWFTDDYILLAKDSSQLYILPRDNSAGVAPLKVTDYHRPNFNGEGYSYGYGGL